MPEPESLYASTLGFAETPAAAQERYNARKSVDPFPHIEAALLNSGDIADYVAAVGMIHPFYPERNKLKVASYEVDLLGKCVRFTGNERKDIEIQIIERGDEFVLGKNEIAFVQLEPEFRLPDYIALRFNLRITHIYRGLLLGTGPLVDPGFSGHLWIPLHNLTGNDYVIRGGEGLVWMEFTKVSKILPLEGRGSRQKHFHGFQPEKNNRTDIMDYLKAADPHRPIRSSIPVLLGEATARASDAKDAAESARKIVQTLGLAAAVGLIAIVFTTWQLVMGVRDRAEEALQQVRVLETRLGLSLDGDSPAPLPHSPTPESPEPTASPK